nr:hypothetical protein BaRGS_008958 [Batillaria attramentaria]
MNRPEVANPFSAADPISDLALVVEGKKLHVHKMILATSSPVFKAMFFPESSTDCKGKDAATELPLPGKNYDDVVNFLLQLYPKYNITSRITDKNLEEVMALADEYQVDFVLDKCEEFIQLSLNLGLVVEGKKLHVHKMILATSSPVFKAMFFPESSTEFKEKNATELPLPGKNYDDVVNFLLQLYPRHNSAPITDKTLEGVVALADEYQVDHLLDKCELFIETQLKSPSNLSANRS